MSGLPHDHVWRDSLKSESNVTGFSFQPTLAVTYPLQMLHFLKSERTSSDGADVLVEARDERHVPRA